MKRKAVGLGKKALPENRDVDTHPHRRERERTRRNRNIIQGRWELDPEEELPHED